MQITKPLRCVDNVSAQGRIQNWRDLQQVMRQHVLIERGALAQCG